MRPQSIGRFEQAYLGSILVWGINLATGWNARIGAVESNPAFAGNPQMLSLVQTMMIGVSLFSLCVSLALWYFTARRASVVTKWIIVALFALSVIGLPFVLMSFKTLGAFGLALNLLTFALTAFAVWMLFTPESRAWFRASDPVDEPPLTPEG